MIKILTCGVFDILHIGHIDFLRNASLFGDLLIVAVSTDECAEKYGKKTIQSFEHRVEIVRSLYCVDMVIPQNSREERQRVIYELCIDTFVTSDKYIGVEYFNPEGCEVIYLPCNQNISTSLIKEAIKNG